MTALSEAAGKLSLAATSLKKRREKDKIARKYQRKIAAFFRQQKATVLDELGKHRYLFSESYQKLSEGPVDFTRQNWDRIWEVIANASDAELQQVIFGAEVEAVTKGAANLKAGIGLFDKATSFNLTNPRAVEWFADKGGSIDYIKGIQRTTGNQLKTIIGAGIDAGKPYNQLAKEISQKFGEFSRDRAQRIAVFETGQAYEEGNSLFAQSLIDDGIQMQERWMTSHDEEVRPEHTANEAEGWVEVGHIYSSGDDAPPTDPGCRCYKEYREAPRK